jgi:hypothetical protein
VRPTGGVGRLDQVEEVGALDLVELEGSGERFQDLVGDAAGVAALQAGVVLDRDAGQQGYLLPA